MSNRPTFATAFLSLILPALVMNGAHASAFAKRASETMPSYEDYQTKNVVIVVESFDPEKREALTSRLVKEFSKRGVETALHADYYPITEPWNREQAERLKVLLGADSLIVVTVGNAKKGEITEGSSNRNLSGPHNDPARSDSFSHPNVDSLRFGGGGSYRSTPTSTTYYTTTLVDIASNEAAWTSEVVVHAKSNSARNTDSEKAAARSIVRSLSEDDHL